MVNNEEINFNEAYNNATSATPAVNSVDTTALAKSDTGEFELNDYLYKTGLQNVFSDYQKNIASLSQDKQKQIQDATYIRELSKKYLGEYASNAGIGDVSGNLIDIYSKYQASKSEIESNYDALELNLQKEYQTAQNGAFENILKNQFNKGVAELDSNAQQVVFDLQSGNTGGLSNINFIESNKDKMSEETYRAVWTAQHTQDVETVTSNIANGYYGYDDTGNQITDAETYANYAKTKFKLTEQEFKAISDSIKWNASVNEANASAGITSITNPYAQDGTVNKDYIQDFDPKYYMDTKENVSKSSSVYKVDGSNEILVQVLDDVTKDKKAVNEVANADLFEGYNTENPDTVLKDGDVFYYEDTANYYMYKNQRWYRMVSTDGYTRAETNATQNSKNWSVSIDVYDGNKEYSGNGFTSKDGSFKTNGKRPDTLTVNNVTYVEDNKSKNSFSPTANDGELTADQKAIVKLFQDTHKGIGTDSGTTKMVGVVFYKGRYWEYNSSGDIVPMKAK